MKKKNQAYQTNPDPPERSDKDFVPAKKRTYTRLEQLLDGQAKKVEKNVERFKFLLHRYAF